MLRLLNQDQIALHLLTQGPFFTIGTEKRIVTFNITFSMVYDYYCNSPNSSELLAQDFWEGGGEVKCVSL